MKNKIKQILLDNLTSAYDLGNIENGGILGGEKTIDKLYELFEDEFTASCQAKISSGKPKKEKKQKPIFVLPDNLWVVRYENPTVGYKGEAVYVTLEADNEEQAKFRAMQNKAFTQYIFMKYFNAKYLSAFKPNPNYTNKGEYTIGNVRYYEGDPRL